MIQSKLLALYLVQSAVFLIEEEKFTERDLKKFFNLMNKNNARVTQSLTNYVE